jgi:hypothetical protein
MVKTIVGQFLTFFFPLPMFQFFKNVSPDSGLKKKIALGYLFIYFN